MMKVTKHERLGHLIKFSSILRIHHPHRGIHYTPPLFPIPFSSSLPSLSTQC